MLNIEQLIRTTRTNWQLRTVKPNHKPNSFLRKSRLINDFRIPDRLHLECTRRFFNTLQSNRMMASSLSPPPKKVKKIHPEQNGTTNNNNKMPGEEFTFSEAPTLDQLRILQNEFATERDWDKFHQPRNLLLAMVGEVGEVAELFQWKGEVKEGLPDWTEKERKHLSQELSDVLIYLVRLSEKCHIDLPKAALEKIALNKKKYPVEKVHGSCKKYNEYE